MCIMSAYAQKFKIENGAFIYNGKPTQLICGEMHYPRIPMEYWRDRIQRAKAMGINTVSTYVFWNIHERKPGVFDFSGQADLAKFIKICGEEGMHVILRPGPYVCAEW
ncbi:MAG: beta-galactosidase, partial [Bacteroidaceae bacterium]